MGCYLQLIGVVLKIVRKNHFYGLPHSTNGEKSRVWSLEADAPPGAFRQKPAPFVVSLELGIWVLGSILRNDTLFAAHITSIDSGVPLVSGDIEVIENYAQYARVHPQEAAP